MPHLTFTISPHCPRDGTGLQFVRDLTQDPDEPEAAYSCPCCDVLYYVTEERRTLRFQPVTSQRPETETG